MPGPAAPSRPVLKLCTSGNKLRLGDRGPGREGALCLSATAIWGVSVGAPVDGRMSSSVTSLYPPHASGTCPSRCDKHKYLQTRHFWREGETTLAGTSGLRFGCCQVQLPRGA